MPYSAEFDPIQYLVQRKYPVSISDLVAMYKPNEKGPTIVEALAGVGEVQAYRDELATKTPEEIQALLAEEAQKQREEQRVAAEFEEKSHFFNQRDATTVDYAHYAKIALWEVEEAVALSLGRNPKVVNWDLIRSKSHSPFVEKYGKRLELVIRAPLPWVKGSYGSKVRPSDFYTWMQRYQVDFPLELGEQLKVFAGAVDWQLACTAHIADKKKLEGQVKELEDAVAKKSKEKAPSTREWNTLTRMAYIMARGGYGWSDDGKKSSSITSAIVQDAETYGEMDADTVNKYLKQGREACQSTVKK